MCEKLMNRKPWSTYNLLVLGVSISIAIISSKPKPNEFSSNLWLLTLLALIVVASFYANSLYCYNELSKLTTKPETTQSQIIVSTSDDNYKGKHSTETKQDDLI